VKPLKPPIAETKYTYIPNYPNATCLMVRLLGSSRWRRLMYQENTRFVRIKGVPYVVPPNIIEDPK